jgi:choline kinase
MEELLALKDQNLISLQNQFYENQEGNTKKILDLQQEVFSLKKREEEYVKVLLTIFSLCSRLFLIVLLTSSRIEIKRRNRCKSFENFK